MAKEEGPTKSWQVDKEEEEAKKISRMVKWFDCDRGYGLIKRADTFEDVIVHISAIEGGQSLKKGASVTFHISHNPKKDKMHNRMVGTHGLNVASHVQQHQKILGSVKWLEADRGYGFIVRDDTNEEIFVHKSDVEVDKPLQAGDRVEFNVKAGARGTKASYVTPILGERGEPYKEFPLGELQVDKEEEEEKDINVKKQHLIPNSLKNRKLWRPNSKCC